MLRVAVDATAIRNRPSGVGFYTLNLLQGLAALQKTESFTLQVYYQPGFKTWLRGNFRPSRRLAQEQETLGNFLGLPLPVTLSDRLSQFPNPILSALEKRFGSARLVHGTDHYCFPCRQRLSLLTIHDLTFCRFPQFVPPIVQGYRERIQRCLPFTQGILTFAESTKADIAETFNFPLDRIFVTPQASRYSAQDTDLQSPQTDSGTIGTLSEKLSHPYFLFVSTLEPRKNVVGLITAFNQFKQQTQLPHRLILAGQLGWKYEPILQAISDSPFRDHIQQLSYVDDATLAGLYRQATAFVYPSFYEGFGLPVLEAMTFGVPVITSDRASLSEVAGDAALLINPDAPESIATALNQVATNSVLQERLRGKSLQRARQFSWQQTAKATLAVYHSLLALG